MKIRVLFVSFLCAVGVILGLQAQDAKEMTELGTKMDKMRIAFGKLGKQIKDPAQNNDSLTQIAILKENAQASVKLEPNPKKIATVPADQQKKFVADYQAAMNSLVSDINKLEAALKAGNNAEAEMILGSLKSAQKSGHDTFRKMPKKN